MAINFPNTPVLDQVYEVGNTSWQWNGTAWIPQGSVVPRTLVMSDPIFLMPNQATSGQTVVLKAKSSSLIQDTTIASFRLTKPDGSTVSELANLSGEASTSFTASGTVGTQLTVKAQAVDSLGNLSKETGYIVTIGTSFVNKANITSPLNEATEVQNGLVIETSAFGSTGAPDTLNRTEFEIRTAILGGGTLVWSGSVDLLTSITVPDDEIPAGTTVYIRARHVGNSLGVGQWSDDVEITMASALPPSEYGAPYQGGFYAGQIKIGSDWYALVVSPLSQETSLVANSEAFLMSTESKSIEDGWSNTNELVTLSSTSFIAATYCYNLQYAGYSDWYLPSLMELELAYRTLKPTNLVNATSQSPVSDISSSSTIGSTTENLTLFPATTVPSRLGYYTNSSGVALYPTTTSSENFQGAGVVEGFDTTTYWTSSAPSSRISGRANFCYFSFSGGFWQGDASSSASSSFTTVLRKVRPFRRVYLRSDI